MLRDKNDPSGIEIDTSENGRIKIHMNSLYQNYGHDPKRAKRRAKEILQSIRKEIYNA